MNIFVPQSVEHLSWLGLFKEMTMYVKILNFVAFHNIFTLRLCSQLAFWHNGGYKILLVTASWTHLV